MLDCAYLGNHVIGCHHLYLSDVIRMLHVVMLTIIFCTLQAMLPFLVLLGMPEESLSPAQRMSSEEPCLL